MRLLFPSWAKFSAGIFDAIAQIPLGPHQVLLQRTQDIFYYCCHFVKNKDKIEIEALTAFSFTGPGFERLFINIKLWSISPWSIMQMCNCTAAALQCQGKYELSTSKKPSTCRPHKVHRAIQESPAPSGKGVFMLTVEYSEKMEIHMHTGCKFFGPAQICALHQCW